MAFRDDLHLGLGSFMATGNSNPRPLSYHASSIATLPRRKPPTLRANKKSKIPRSSTYSSSVDGLSDSLSRMRMGPALAESSCTIRELMDILKAPGGGHYVLPTDPYNEVYPNIYIGDASTAMCTGVLNRLGVTHVLNAAQGTERDYGFVNTNAGFYRHSGIHFLGIPALDMMSFHLEPYFEEAANFIHDALTNNGKVLVHCRCGISRSSTLVLAYLMLKRNMTAQEAVRRVREGREIIPNTGFLRQLCNLNERLQKERKVRRHHQENNLQSILVCS